MEEGCVWRCVNSAHNGDVRQDDEPEHRESAHLALSMGNAEFEQAPCNIEGPGIDSELSPGRCFTGCVGWHSSSPSRIIMWSFDHPHRSLGTPDAKKHVGLGVREERAGSGRRNSDLPTSHTFCLLAVRRCKSLPRGVTPANDMSAVHYGCIASSACAPGS